MSNHPTLIAILLLSLAAAPSAARAAGISLPSGDPVLPLLLLCAGGVVFAAVFRRKEGGTERPAAGKAAAPRGHLRWLRQPVCVFDRAMRVTECSESFVSIWKTKYGMAPAEGVALQAMFPSAGQEGERHGWADRMARGFKGERFARELQVREGNTVRTYDVTFTPLRVGGEVATVTVAFEDVTRALAAERALVASEERYQAFTGQSTEAIWRIDVTPGIPVELPQEEQLRLFQARARVAECNEAAAAVFGIARAELAFGRRASAVLRLETPEGLDLLRRLVAANYRLLDVEGTGPDQAGGVRHYLTNYAGVVADGVLVRLWGMARDITDRRQAEEALRQRSEVYRTIVDTTGEWVWETDLEGRLVFSNNAVEDILGCPADEAVGQERLAFLDVEDRSAMVVILRNSVESGRGWRNTVLRARHRDGSIRWIESSCAPVFDAQGNLVRLRGTDRDVTDRKRAEDSLRESREWLAAMFEASRDGIMVEENEVIIYANGSYARMFGYDRPEEIFFKSVRDFYAPEDRERLLEEARRRVRGEEAPAVFEFRGRTRTGGVIALEASVATADVLGKKFVVSSVRDIADRKAAEDALRWQKVYFQQLFESAPEGVAIIDRGDRILRANREFARMFGYTREEVEGQRIVDLIAPEEKRSEVMDLTSRVNAGEQVSIETVRRRKDGTTVEVSILGTPLPMPGGEAVVYGVYRDITERKREELLRSALYRISQTAAATGDLAEFFAALHNIIGGLMEARNFYIAEHTAATDEVRFVFWQDERDACPAPRSGRRGLTEYVLRTGAPLLANRETFNRLVAEGHVEVMGEPPSAWLGVPLRYRDHTYGMLAVQSYTPDIAFGEREKELLTFVSQHIAAALLSKQAEDALKRSEAEARKLALVASRTDNAVVITDAGGVIEWVNDGFTRLTGWPLEEVVGRRPAAFLQGADTDWGTVQRMKDALAREEGFHEEILNYARDGHTYWIDIEVQPIRNEAGRVSNYIAIERDITDRKRIEREREKFVSLVENSSDLITMTSPEGEILYLNDAGRRLLGLQGHSAGVRFRIEDFLSPESLRVFRESIAPATLATGRWEGEIRVVRPATGEQVPITGNAFVVRDPDTGAPLCYAAILRDVTERKKAEEDMRYQKRFVRQVIDTDPNLIYVKDEEGRFLFVNHAVAELFGSTIEKIVAAQSPDLPEHLTRLSGRQGAEQEVIRTMHELVFEESYRKQDGTEITFLTLLKPLVLSDNVPRVLGISANITERKRAEEELRKAKDAAESANRLKSEFLANMSHEIRTPMNGILGMTQLALETRLTDEQREYLELVKTSGDALLRIINDILDFSKIEARKLELEDAEFRVRDLVHEVTRMMDIRAREKGIALEMSIDESVPETVVADHARLRQILTNLVGNAVKFTEHGRVVVACVAVPAGTGEQEGCVELRWTVSDTGIGIPADKQGIIFDPFTQVDGSATRRYGGTGLGLSITSQLVGLMGGSIAVESEEGRGTAFRFTVRAGVPLSPRGLQEPLEDVHVYLLGQAAGTIAAAATAAGAACESFTGGDECAARIARGGLPQAGLFVVAAQTGAEASAVRKALDVARPGARTAVIILLPEGTALTDTQGADALLSLPAEKPVLLDLLSSLADDVSRKGDDAGPGAPARRLSVLLAEDNPLNQRLLHRMLERRGHAVALAANGREAVELFSRGGYDLVLMDIQMPEMDGFEATRCIRAAEEGSGRHTPVVAVTAHAMAGFRERVLAAGMDEYLTKPVRPAELVAVIERICGAGSPRAAQGAAGPGGVFDERSTLARLDGDMDLLSQIMEIFVESCPAQMSEIRDALGRGDAEGIARSAHALRGALSNFTAPEALEVVQRLEQAGRSGQLTDIGEAYRQLEGVVERLARAFERFRQSAPSQQRSPS